MDINQWLVAINHKLNFIHGQDLDTWNVILHEKFIIILLYRQFSYVLSNKANDSLNNPGRLNSRKVNFRILSFTTYRFNTILSYSSNLVKSTRHSKEPLRSIHH